MSGPATTIQPTTEATLLVADDRRVSRTQPLLIALIAALGVVSAGIYYGALVRPYSLVRWVEVPLRDLGKIGGYDPEAGWRYSVPLVALWLLYLAAWWLVVRLRGERAALAMAGAGALGCGTVLLFLYPITAADIFNYTLYGLVQHAGGNPLVELPNAIIGPPLIDYSAWPAYPSPYGPAWQAIAWLVTGATGDRLLAGILLFKVVLLALHMFNLALVARLAVASGVARPGVAALAYGWNPLLLYEVPGNGHNDILTLTCLFLALTALTAHRADVLTLPLATFGALGKAAGALFLAPLALAWLPRLWRERRPRALVVAGALALALIVICYGPYWADGHALDGIRRQANLHTTSFATLAMAMNERAGPHFVPAELLDRLKLVALAAIALIVLITRPRDTSAGETARGAFDAVLAYLLIGALWFQPWYLVPLVGLAPLVGTARRAIAVAYAVGATGSYIVYFYVWPALGWTNDRLLVQGIAVGVAHGPALVALLGAGCWALWRRLKRGGTQASGWQAPPADRDTAPIAPIHQTGSPE